MIGWCLSGGIIHAIPPTEYVSIRCQKIYVYIYIHIYIYIFLCFWDQKAKLWSQWRRCSPTAPVNQEPFEWLRSYSDLKEFITCGKDAGSLLATDPRCLVFTISVWDTDCLGWAYFTTIHRKHWNNYCFLVSKLMFDSFALNQRAVFRNDENILKLSSVSWRVNTTCVAMQLLMYPKCWNLQNSRK